MTAPAEAATEVLTVGESMVSFRVPGPLAQGGTATIHLAGAESNVAIGLARLGHRAAWAGRVGDDEFGQLVLRQLRAEGVGTAGARTDRDRPTGLMFLERRAADVARVAYRRAGSAGSALAVADLEGALTPPPRLLHLTGITPALSATARECVEWLLPAARQAGVGVSFDVNHRARLWSREQAREVLTPLAAQADLVVASEDELDLVAPGDEQAAAARLLGAGVAEVVVKRGSRGSTAWTADGRLDQPALAVTAVDTVGAGDAFTAGYLSALLDGLDVAERLRRGTCCGAFAVSTAGDWEGLPRREELRVFDAHDPEATLR